MTDTVLNDDARARASWSMYVRINSTTCNSTQSSKLLITRRHYIPQIVMQKTYFIDFGWTEA